MLYFVIWTFIFVLAIAGRSFNNHIKKVWLIVVFIILTSLFGFRYCVGTDTINYMRINDYLPTLSQYQLKNVLLYGLEPLYVLLTALCKEITEDFYLVQLLQAAFLNYSVIRFSYKYSTNPFLSLLLYNSVVGLYFNTEIIRESFSVAIFLLNFDNLIAKRWHRYYLLAVLSTLFHMSALITLLAPFAMKLQYNRKFPLYVLLFVIVGVPIGEYFSAFLDYDIFRGRVEKYMDITDRKGLNVYWTIFEVIKFAVLPLFALSIGHAIHYKDRLESMVCFNLLLGLGCIFFKLIFARFANYVTIYFLVYSANVVALYFDKRKLSVYKHRIWAVVFIMSLFVVYVRYHAGQWHKWYPYYSIFDRDKEDVKKLPRYFE